MKKTLTILAALALAMTAKADDRTLTLAGVDSANINVTFKNVVNKTRNSFTLKMGTATWPMLIGPYQAVTVDPLAEAMGKATKTGSGYGGGGGGGKHELGPLSGKVEIIVTDATTGDWGTMTVNIPFVSGSISVRNDGGGDNYTVTGYDVTVGGVNITTNGVVISVAQKLLWKPKAQ
jgi:hypothetical protein